MESIRLLGGSWHGRKMQISNPHNKIYLFKRPRRKKWIPVISELDPDETIIYNDQEIYERKYVRNIKGTGAPNRWIVETKVAYVKCGSDIKNSTIWNLGFHLETRLTDSYGIDV